MNILKIYVKFCFDSRVLILEYQECPASPEYRELLVPRVEMASKERGAASESGDHKALWEYQGKLDHGAPEGSKGEEGKKGEIGKVGAKGNTGIPGNAGPRGFIGSKGDKGSMGTNGSTGNPGSIGPRGFKGTKGENGIGIKGDKGDAVNMDSRQRANWKQCAWRRGTDTDDGKIMVSHRRGFTKLLG